MNLAHHRAAVERLMTDTWTFRRPVDKRDLVVDPDTDELVSGAPPTVVYGPGPGLTASLDPDLVGASVTVLEVHAGTHRLTRRLIVSDVHRRPRFP